MDASTAASIAAASVAALAAGFTAWGTSTLARVGKEQNLREQKRQEREDTPHLLLTGAPHSEIGGYRVEFVNLSPHALWLDGVYADWNAEGDRRLGLRASDRPHELTVEDQQTPLLERASVAPGDWAWLRWPFGMLDPSETARAEIVAEFYYAPTGNEVHRRAWRVHGVPHHALKIKEIPLPAWFVEWKEEVV